MFDNIHIIVFCSLQTFDVIMIFNIYNILKSILFLIPPETSHNLAIKYIKTGLLPNYTTSKLIQPILHTKLFNLSFTNPIGLAAGFDKNAECINQLHKIGFSFLEMGTVTPIAQYGNPKPRMIRIENEQAIINRMGFNNNGCNNFLYNLKRKKTKCIIGSSISKNYNSSNNIDDYTYLINKLHTHSDYIAINISSPNTLNLRLLQYKDNFTELLKSITKTRNELYKKTTKYTPLLIKLSPDLDDNTKIDIANNLIQYKIDGIILTNTTTNRSMINNKYKNETGGLSGKPLSELSNRTIEDMYKLTKHNIPIIGSGGIMSAQEAYKKIKLGASLVQIYTALIYKGPGIVHRINEELANLVIKDGFSNIKEAIGSDIKTTN